MKGYFWYLDKTRIVDSTRHSKPDKKLSRKKKKALQNCKTLPLPSFIPRPRNVSPSEQEEDERGPMPTSAIKDLLKKWEAVRAMVLERHPNQADVSRVGDLYNDNAINYFRKILKKREKQSTLDMFFNAP
ncbi:uncharacterized protein TNCV_3417891 [Trichonephila clavipes]|nr:uncharacterized protein TNCV_3417891 [Trichonephila clavipes]